MSFLEVGKPGLLRWVLQQKEMYSGVFRGLANDEDEIVIYVLSTLRDRVLTLESLKEMYSGVFRGLANDEDEIVIYVLSTLRDRVLTPESLVPPGLRSVLFGSITLDQLICISGRENGGIAAEIAHSVLVMVCTDSSNGLMPDLKRHPDPLRGNPKRLLGLMKRLKSTEVDYHRDLLLDIRHPDPLRGNPKRLLGLMKKLKSTEVDYHRDLLLDIASGRPSLGSAYLDEFPYNLEDLASPSCVEGSTGQTRIIIHIVTNSTILCHPDGKYSHDDLKGVGMSRDLDKFTRLIVEENLGDLYKELNSKEAKRQNAVLSLLASVVRRGSGLASDVAKNFDFKFTIFPKLAECKHKRTEVKRKHSTRKSFVRFAMSFLEVGKPGLLRWVLQQKEMYSGVFRGLANDEDEIVIYVLSTLRDRVLTPESLVPPELRSVLFGSVTLDQLICISGRENGGIAAEIAHSVLVMVCTDSSNGLMPDLKRHPDPLRGNPKRLLGLMKRLKSTEVDYHRDLLLDIVSGRPSLGSAYLDESLATWKILPHPPAAKLVSSVGNCIPFCFLDSHSQEPPSFSRPDVQNIIKCIGPRPFTRLIINKGLLHSDSLVKHATLRFVLEVLKLLDSFMGALNNGSYYSNQMIQRLISLKQDIENEAWILLPDPQVLLSLVASLNAHYKSSGLCLKRAADSDIMLEHNINGFKKLKKCSVYDETDILVSGISSSSDVGLPEDGAGVLDTYNGDKFENGDDHTKVIAEIWDLQQSSMPTMALEDEETYFYSKLLDTLKIYRRTMPGFLGGSFDFFKVLPSKPLALPTILQQSLLSLLLEDIGWSSKCEVPARMQPLMYKHLHTFINILIYSSVKDIKDQAYILAQAAMLSTGAFDKNLWEIGAWFLFLPGYTGDNFFVSEQEVEVGLLSSLISLLLSERLEDRCSVVDASGDLCEWEPLKNLLLFSESVAKRQSCSISSTDRKLVGADNSFIHSLCEVKRVLRSGDGERQGLTEISTAFLFSMLCTTPIEIIDNFSSVISISQHLLGVPFSLFLCVFYHEESLLNGIFKSWPEKFPSNSDDSSDVGDTKSSLFRFLKVFLLRNILELTANMRDCLVKLHSLPCIEQLARSTFLYRFEDHATLEVLRSVLALLSEGKFSLSVVLQLLLAHSQFAPTISSALKSSGFSQSGVIFRPMSSFLRALILPDTEQNDHDGKNLLQRSELYRKQLELVKLLRILFRFKARQCGFDSEKEIGINSRELLFLLLSSYSATLGELDLEIYNLMHEIEIADESNSGSIDEMDFLWGSAAINIRKEREKEQDMSCDKINDIEAAKECRRSQFRENLPINPKLCAYTVLCFPYYRTVGEGILSSNKLHQDNSEHMVEARSATASSANVEKIQIYDPVFILRLSIHSLSMGYIDPMEFASLGLLAVALVSISSPDDEMRKMGYEAVGRFKTALEKWQKRKDVIRLRLLLTYLQNGIEEPWQRIPSIIAIFVAEASLILLDPSHEHYSSISKLLMCSPKSNMKSIPLFQDFFWSSSVNFKTDRLWMFRLLYVGLNSDDDAQIFIRNSILEVALSFYASPLSDNESKELILQVLYRLSFVLLLVVKKSIKLHKLSRYLVEQCGLISWLSSVVLFLCEKLYQDQRMYSLTQLTMLLEVVNDVISSRNGDEWFQTFALEQLAELSSHLYKILVGDIKYGVEITPPALAHCHIYSRLINRPPQGKLTLLIKLMNLARVFEEVVNEDEKKIGC
ncbi:unnamed protein product [Ilex paraguariensis]|uniref:Nucleolar pre-ribosomal-associated protein 1 n=1 Tax=Ilex paraguariensis TaxID=185542 RepID=A0ABC8SXM6_9AQUA